MVLRETVIPRPLSTNIETGMASFQGGPCGKLSQSAATLTRCLRIRSNRGSWRTGLVRSLVPPSQTADAFTAPSLVDDAHTSCRDGLRPFVRVGHDTRPDPRPHSANQHTVAQGEIGIHDPQLSSALTAQFTWLARHAGVRGRIVVDGAIAPDQLTFLVTRAADQDVTHCGAGNAIYDPAINTIFVDELLVQPTELNVIGTNSVNSMFSMRELRFVTSYLNFIIAHELGHWQKHDHAAAFFYYGWNDGAASLGDEQAADASAVRTLLDGQMSSDIPDVVRRNNAILAAAVDDSSVTGDQRATADVVGGVLMLIETSLFSSSPFSPYYADAKHPSLLARARSAVDTMQRTRRSPLPPVEARLVETEIRRFSALRVWRHREIMLPGPLQKADVRAGALWLGRTDIPDERDNRLPEQLYRISLADLRNDRASGPLSEPRPVMIGYSKIGKEYDYAEGFGAWVNRKFEDGDPTVGLPGKSEPLGIKEYPLWAKDARGVDVQVGSSWSISDLGRLKGGEVTSIALIAAVRAKVALADVQLGAPRVVDTQILVPISARDTVGRAIFRVFSIQKIAPLEIDEVEGYRLDTLLDVDIANAVQTGSTWWVPTRVNVGRQGERLQLWQLSLHDKQAFDWVPLLVGEVRAADPSAPLAHYEPGAFRAFPLSNGAVVFGYDGDTLYVVQPQRTKPEIVFHPAGKGLKILDLGSGLLAFWTLHARKVYLVDTSEKGEQR